MFALFPDEHLTDVVWILACGYKLLVFGELGQEIPGPPRKVTRPEY